MKTPDSLFVKFITVIFTMAIVIIISQNNAESKIIYNKVDTTLCSTPDDFWIEYNADINKDGINDFFFHHAYQGNIVCELYSDAAHFNNEVLVYTDEVSPIEPVALNAGEVIDEGKSVWYDSYNGMSTSAMYFGENWIGKDNKFIAVRFKTDDNYRYGWIRVYIPEDTSYIKIIDFAYETNPNSSIIVSETGSVIPELIGPWIGTTTDTALTLKWTVPATVRFQLQVSKNKDFNNCIVDVDTITQGYFLLTGLQHSTKYFWRVGSIINDTAVTEFSNAWYFTTRQSLSVNDINIKKYQVISYPLPFVNSNILSMVLNNNSKIKIEIFSSSGVKLGDLIDCNLPEGDYHFLWEPDNIPSSVYFYLIDINGDKMIYKTIYHDN